MEPLYFKQFLEFSEKTPGYLDAVRDELGIDPKTWAKNPLWMGNISMGKLSYNGIMYQIVRMVEKDGRVTGAIIKPAAEQGKTQRAYYDRGGKMIRVDAAPSGEQFVPINMLNSMLTQGMMPAGGAAGAMPGGGTL
jgi:hypothetical protein